MESNRAATGNWAIFGLFPSCDAEKSRSRSFPFERLQELPLMHLYSEYEVPSSSLWWVIVRRLDGRTDGRTDVLTQRSCGVQACGVQSNCGGVRMSPEATCELQNLTGFVGCFDHKNLWAAKMAGFVGCLGRKNLWGAVHLMCGVRMSPEATCELQNTARFVGCLGWKNLWGFLTVRICGVSWP